jgi:hypothetical protein
MSKRPSLAAAERDAGQTLNLVAGVAAEPVETAPKRARSKRSKAPAPKPQASQPVRLEPVLYRVTLEQRRALNAEAFKRAEERGSGKPDASEVIREILTAWMEER